MSLGFYYFSNFLLLCLAFLSRAAVIIASFSTQGSSPNAPGRTKTFDRELSRRTFLLRRLSLFALSCRFWSLITFLATSLRILATSLIQAGLTGSRISIPRTTSFIVSGSPPTLSNASAKASAPLVLESLLAQIFFFATGFSFTIWGWKQKTK